jgi:hypothetical protein
VVTETLTTSPSSVITPEVVTPTTQPPSAVIPVTQPGYGCAAAIAYLEAHANPAFAIECPGNANGNEAWTCADSPGCENRAFIAIADPCPAAYMNEAHNSWGQPPWDPFGDCQDPVGAAAGS